jgi:hypothetical protein
MIASIIVMPMGQQIALEPFVGNAADTGRQGVQLLGRDIRVVEHVV